MWLISNSISQQLMFNASPNFTTHRCIKHWIPQTRNPKKQLDNYLSSLQSRHRPRKPLLMKCCTHSSFFDSATSPATSATFFRVAKFWSGWIPELIISAILRAWYNKMTNCLFIRWHINSTYCCRCYHIVVCQSVTLVLPAKNDRNKCQKEDRKKTEKSFYKNTNAKI